MNVCLSLFGFLRAFGNLGTRPNESTRFVSITMVDTAEPGPPPGFFFVGSDDDDATTMSVDDLVVPSGNHDQSSPTSLPQTPSSDCQSRPSSLQEKLFLDDSDDDGLVPIDSLKRLQSAMETDSDVDIVQEGPASSTISSPLVKRNPDSSPPQKKHRKSLIPQAVPLAGHFPTYFGEFLVPNAWSTVSGKGYVKQEEEIYVRREQEECESMSAKSKLKGSSKKPTKMKQVTLSSMLKKQPQKATKKKTDTIVRLVNKNRIGAFPHEFTMFTTYNPTQNLAGCLQRLRGGYRNCLSSVCFILPICSQF